MKKNIFIITLLMITQFVLAQSPGGVNSGLTAWFKADQGVTIVTGAVSQWQEQSGNAAFSGNHPTQATVANRPVYNNSATANLNFNPYITFDGTNDRLSTGSILSSTIRNVAGKTATVYIMARSTDTNDGTFFDHGLTLEANFIYTWQRAAFGSTTDKTLTTVFGNQNIIYSGSRRGNNTLDLFANGAANGTSTTQSNGTLNGIDNFSIGMNTVLGDPYDGDISEIIIYNTNHTALEKQKVESYLAIKYGITLNQTIATNYIASDATVVWNATTNASYNNNITGIGRDNNSGLNQRQSKSQNGGNQAIIGLNSVTSTGSTGTFALDKQFLVWGDNNATGVTTHSADGSNVFNRSNKIWFADNTGGDFANGVQILLPASLFMNNTTNPKLLYRTTNATFSAGSNTVIDLQFFSTINGVSYAVFNLTAAQASVDFYFSPANIPGPGGVATNLAAWYKADGTINTTQWNDESGNAKHMLAAGNGTAANMPTLDNSLGVLNNFNPSVAFLSNAVAARKWTMTASGNDVFSNTTTPGTIFNISSFPSTTIYDIPQMYSFEQDDPGFNLFTDRNADKDIRVVFQRDDGGTGVAGWDFSVPGVSQTKPLLTAHAWNYAAGGNTFTFNGYDYTPSTNTLIGGMSSRYIFGAETIAGGGEAHSGYTSENIVFSTNWASNSNERKRINSYLAIKYGITLLGTGTLGAGNTDATFGGQFNYLSADSTIIWNGTTNATYHNGVAGIGRDDASTLNQKQSISVNSGNQVIFGLGTVAATNVANTNTFTLDKQFLVWGDNNMTGIVALSDPSSPNDYSRLARTWFVDNTNSFAQNTQLLIPVALTTGGTSPKFIMNTSSTFPAGSNTYIPLSTTTTVNAVSYYVVNLTAAQVATDFYFSVVVNHKAPGGVSGNLSAWLKADVGTNTTTNGAAVTSWQNQSPALGTALQKGTAPLYNSITHNFNPSISINALTNNAGLELLNVFATTAQREVTLYATGSRPTYPNQWIGWAGFYNNNDNLDNPWIGTFGPTYYYYNFTGTNGSNNISSIANYQPNYPYINGLTQLSGALSATTGTNFIRNGFTVPYTGNTTGTRTVSKDLRIFHDDNTFGYGNIDEVIAYDRVITPAERNRIESYLAIKYGTTLKSNTDNTITALGSRNYYNSNGSIVWDISVSPAYNYNIFGIANDGFSTLDQKVSKSENTNIGSTIVLTVATNPNFTASNLNVSRTSLTNGQYLLFGDDNAPVTSFSNGTVTASDGTSFNVMRKWKVTDTNALDCTYLRFDATGFPALAIGEKYFLIVSDNATFSSNVTYKEVTRTANAIDVIINFGDNTSNYFTIAKKNPGITASNLNNAVTGINTIPSMSTWKPTTKNTYLEINSNAKGVVISRVANTAAITTPIEGMLIYDLSDDTFKVYNGSTWRSLGISEDSSATFCN